MSSVNFEEEYLVILGDGYRIELDKDFLLKTTKDYKDWLDEDEVIDNE